MRFLIVCFFLYRAEGGVFLNVTHKLECEQEWNFSVASCYKIMNQPLIWEEAKNSCKQINGKLAEPNTESAIKFVAQLASEKGENVWLGGTDSVQEGVFVWSITRTNITLNDWDSGQPNDSGGNQDCLEIWNRNGFKWNDWNCNSEKHFVCEKRANQTERLNVKVLSGENLTLFCPNDNMLPVDVVDVFWKALLNGKNATEFPDYITGGNLTHSSLFIESIQKSDAGIYECHLNATTGHRTTYAYNISVIVVESDCNCQYRCDGKEETKSTQLDQYKNLTYSELVQALQPVLLKLQKELKVNKTKLSSQIRKRTSAPDYRKSSQTIGYAGLAFVCFVIGLIAMFDIVSLLQFLGMFHI